MRFWRGEWLRWLILATVALLMSHLPILRSGPGYLADGDELLYRAWSRDIVMHGSSALVDGVHKVSGPMMHPWLLFVPPAWLCRELGLGIGSIGLVWRTLAGLGIVAGLYIVSLTAVRGRRLATALAACLICDAGLIFGQPGGRGLVIATTLWHGSNADFDSEPYVMAHLRVVTPGLALPLLLVHFAGMLWARRTGKSRDLLVAVLSFGLLFHVYFYFWTTALAAICLVILLDPGGRRVYCRVLVGGLILGLPAIVSGMAIKASTSADWLLRTDKFVPIDRFSELILPWKVMTVWLLTTPWVVLRRRELAYLWCFVGAGLAGLNSQILTGRQFENFHWAMAMGLAQTILLVSLLGPIIEPRMHGKVGFFFALIFIAQIGLGLALRDQEGSRTAETRYWAELRRTFAAENLIIPPGSILAGDERITLMLAGAGEIYPVSSRLVEYSAKADDNELDQRVILNLFLLGTPREQVESLVMGPPGKLSREALALRDPVVARTQRDRRLILINQIYQDPVPFLKQFQVDFVLIDRQTKQDHLRSLGNKVMQGKIWDLWRLGVEPPSANLDVTGRA